MHCTGIFIHVSDQWIFEQFLNYLKEVIEYRSLP